MMKEVEVLFQITKQGAWTTQLPFWGAEGEKIL